MRQPVFLIIPVLACSLSLADGLPKEAKDRLKSRYIQSDVYLPISDKGWNIKRLGTAFVVLKPGLVAGADVINRYGRDKADTQVFLSKGTIVRFTKHTHPLTPGTIVGMDYLKMTDSEIWLSFRTTDQQVVTRGIGAFKDNYAENVSTIVRFSFPADTLRAGDLEPITAEIEQWVRPFPSYDEAAAFSQVLTREQARAEVKEVKLGMTIAEVETMLGLPKTKADLGGKVLYKYDDMTIEFQDGKVSDVKF